MIDGKIIMPQTLRLQNCGSCPKQLMIFKGLIRLWRTCAPLAHSSEILKNQKESLLSKVKLNLRF
jgi:hypothetical protein